MATAVVEKRESDASCVECTHEGRMYSPTVDILETDDELQLFADVPGASPSDIDVRYDQGELTIHARVPQRQPGNTDYLVREYGVGDYFRTFEIGEDVDINNITATVSNGVLMLRLPKVEQVRPRRIKVQAV